MRKRHCQHDTKNQIPFRIVEGCHSCALAHKAKIRSNENNKKIVERREECSSSTLQILERKKEKLEKKTENREQQSRCGPSVRLSLIVYVSFLKEFLFFYHSNNFLFWFFMKGLFHILFTWDSLSIKDKIK